MIRLWLVGLVRERKGRLAATAAGVAVTVALLALLGSFLSLSSSSMTRRAVGGLPVDWQVQLVPGVDPGMIAAAIRQAARVSRLQPVGYSDVDGFETHTGGTVQMTGKGKVLGLSPAYLRDFSAQFRLLLGSLHGVLIAQQTAANLHATVGDLVTIHRPGLPVAEVKVAGVVDLPHADSMFQAVGVPPGAAPQAPPDNILLLPMDDWHRLFDPQAAIRPDSIRQQLHVGLDHHALPVNPEAAFSAAQAMARNLEARIAGNGLVANNLAARLDAVRSDALYARVLFLFLGAPGAFLAVLLTLATVASGAGQRRRDQALLRIRGASTARILQLAAVEAGCISLAGIAGGLVLAITIGRIALSVWLIDAATAFWAIGAALAGILLAHAAILGSAWLNARHSTVQAARLAVGMAPPMLWQRVGLDVIFIALAAIIFWKTKSTGYQVVLAPEGTPSSSVDYLAFLAPVFMWLGLGLLTVRLCLWGLPRAKDSLARLYQPLAGRLAGVAAAAMSRQRRRITQGIAMVGLAFAFASSTAIFNTTYHAQARVDAELTNGADVTVTGTMQAPASAKLKELAAIPGVAAAQAMQHRLVYVGADLQDLYGIDPIHIGEATRMSNAYFANGDAGKTLAQLARTPDGVLVSEETVQDFQLRPGDEINLRLQSVTDHQYHPVRFRFIGVVREFPTAPRDSFLVANAAYIAQQTGAAGAEVVLMKTTRPPAQVAAAAHALVASLPGAKVSDIGEAQRLIGSSLTAVDLRGLTLIELGLAVIMVAGATGLVLAIGLADRQRMFAILAVLGSKPHQLGAFLWSEATVLFVAGSLIGLATGFLLAWMLVKLLIGAFDPPPDALSIPWIYLLALIGVAFASAAAAVFAARRELHVPAVQRLREI